MVGGVNLAGRVTVWMAGHGLSLVTPKRPQWMKQQPLQEEFQ